MTEINIPGKGNIKAENLVLDYNGTLAEDGALIPGVKTLLNSLAEVFRIHVITADTFGTAKANLKDADCSLIILRSEDQQRAKKEFVLKLGAAVSVAVGNGLNDSLMLKEAALGIIIIQKEGAAVQSLINADIACSNIIDALDLLINPERIAATLRC